jgi:hypothetical protein
VEPASGGGLQNGSSASIAKALFVRQQLHWLKECVVRRRSGRPELSWDEYRQFYKSLPWYVRANAWRKDTAKVLYKAGAFQYAQQTYYRLAPTVIAAAILQPGYTIRQIAAKLRLRRS